METITAELRAAGCVFAEDEARLLTEAAASPDELRALTARRVAGEPLEQVVGWAEFLGMRIWVEPGVFVPRRRTEFLAARAIDFLAVRATGFAAVRATGFAAARPAGLARPDTIVVDLCCGAGAIAAAVAPYAAQVHAADIDPAAVRCARRNVPGPVYQGDLYDALPGSLRGRITVLTANVPYVPAAELAFLPAEARLHEPRAALDGGPDGLGLARRVAAGAPGWLAPGGALLIETSAGQADTAARIFAAAGLAPRVTGDPETGAAVIIGTAG